VNKYSENQESSKIFDLYDLSDSVEAELNNSLVIVNEIVKRKQLDSKPEFYIIGGAAMVFHGLNYNATLDIDIANKIGDNIRDAISDFVSDDASNVVILGDNYKSRAVKIKSNLDAINVYIVSQEDLLITKLLGAKVRRKDRDALKHSGLLNAESVENAINVLKVEYETTLANTLIQDAKSMLLNYWEGEDL
jgi:hypothetical protein